ncbi:MAG TPA: 2-oxo acid dehydrogenase subunit E2 [Candidatus Omnitrophota bacterium]|nr:2-oxo acid dehydrogenase subunit E2 [Candidatus Omnitrophota bacterium]
MIDFKLPAVGENIEKGTVIKLLVSVGEAVAKGQDLLELETDKATIPVPSPNNGVIKEIFIKEGDEVKVGAVIMKIETRQHSSNAGEASPDLQKKSGWPPAAKISEQKPKIATKTTTRAVPQPMSRTPLPNEAIPPQTNVPAAPVVRRLARELGIVISQVQGSGPGGRISDDDVKAFAKQIILGAGQMGGGLAKKTLPDFTKWGEVERQPMNNIRKITAEHLSYCWQTIPHVTQFDNADITELEDLRKNRSTDHRKLTITAFLLKVMAWGLKEFPQFNSSVDMDTQEIIYKKYIHLGVAVDTDRGLLVPVIRDVDKKSIVELTDELGKMAERARTRKTSLEELHGSSMALTNLGGIGGTHFTPIINWPDVAILGVSRGVWEPVYADGKFIPRLKLPLSLSYDHRIIDGADGARFLRWVCRKIEQTSWADELR